MSMGFKFIGESHTIIFDLDRGFFWGTNSEARELFPNGLVASESSVWDYLTEHGAKSKIKSVKLVEPKFPKSSEAWSCNSRLRVFTKSVVSGDEITGISAEKLIKYCGVHIEYQQ
ncbi:unnamed protein product [Linum tenue]|uniref:Uncharacterized protein n=1 Tax=Linum tenue TaxID=586396 RepID=A0AAV0ISJ6_9ROSI|nr:unnamed protein product [Linum tenue]